MKPKKNVTSVTVDRSSFEEVFNASNLGKTLTPMVYRIAEGKIFTKMKNEGSTVILWIDGWPISESEGEVTMIFSIGEILKDINLFNKESPITIESDGNEITLKDKDGNLFIYPQDDIETTTEFNKMLDYQDGYPMIPHYGDDESVVKGKSKTRVVIDASELKRVVGGMDSTDVDYAEFTFSENGNYSRLGYQGDKLKKRGRVMLDVISFEGDDIDFVVPEVFSKIFDVLSGEIEIFGSQDSRTVIFRKEYGEEKAVSVGLSKNRPEE